MSLKFPNKKQTEMFNAIDSLNKEDYFNETYYLYTESFQKLVRSFLIYFINYGTDIEKKFFTDFVNNNKRDIIRSYISRLFSKRPLVFVGENDRWKLKSGEYGNDWKTVGKDNQKEPLIIDNYLTYNELELSALLSISIKTPFINNGNRFNNGIPSNKNDYEKEGIYIGQVGPRFEVPGYMEWKHMVITPEQNTKKNGYGRCYGVTKEKEYLKMFEDFYQTTFPSFHELTELKNQEQLMENYYYIPELNYFFNVKVYKQRIRYTISLFLQDAIFRAKKENKKAYCYIVGLGLGVWKLFDKQTEYYISAILSLLKNKTIKKYISKIYIFTFESRKYYTLFNEDQNIEEGFVEFGTRNPCEKVSSNELLVANWAFDSNSYIGNEYWDGNYNASGDPAAASCSFISYIGCPELNKNL